MRPPTCIGPERAAHSPSSRRPSPISARSFEVKLACSSVCRTAAEPSARCNAAPGLLVVRADRDARRRLSALRRIPGWANPPQPRVRVFSFRRSGVRRCPARIVAAILVAAADQAAGTRINSPPPISFLLLNTGGAPPAPSGLRWPRCAPTTRSRRRRSSVGLRRARSGQVGAVLDLSPHSRRRDRSAIPAKVAALCERRAEIASLPRDQPPRHTFPASVWHRHNLDYPVSPEKPALAHSVTVPGQEVS